MCVCVCVYACIMHVCMFICAYECMYVSMHAYTYVYMYVLNQNIGVSTLFKMSCVIGHNYIGLYKILDDTTPTIILHYEYAANISNREMLS